MRNQLSIDELKAVITNLGVSVDDSVLSRHIIDTIGELSHSNPISMDSKLIELENGTHTYSMDDDMALITYAAFNDRSILLTTDVELNAYSIIWKSSSGDPYALTSTKLDRQIRLFPTPDFDSTGFIPTTGTPLGADYPTDELFVLFANYPTNYEQLTTLPLALIVLGLEKTNLSDDAVDIEIGFAAVDLGNLLMDWIS